MDISDARAGVQPEAIISKAWKERPREDVLAGPGNDCHSYLE
jgi:hypothetical protein